MKRNIYLYIGTAALLITGFLLGTKLYLKSQEEQYSFLAQENAQIFLREHAPRYGSKDAKVFLIEFLDPECETCRRFYPLVKNLLKEFDGRVQLIIRYAPFHGNSKLVVRILEAVRMQGKYWEALELLFDKQPEWGSHHHPRPELIFTYLPQLGIDMEKLKNDILDPRIDNILKQDMDDLETLNVRKTPSFFVNGRPLQKFGLESLRSLIAEEVENNY